MRLLRPRPGLEFASFLERAVFSSALGLGAAAYLILALGLAQWLYPWAIIGVFAALAAVAWREVGELLVGVARGLRGFRSRPVTVGGAAATVFLAAMIVLAVLGALAPASQNDWDGLSYHLAVPKLYLQHHGVYFIGWLSHSNFPFTLEMLYAAGLALHGQAAAKLFHALSGMLLALALLAFGSTHWQRRHGALAAVVLLSAPVVAWEATAAFNDLAAALFTLLSLYAFINWWSERGARWLPVAAVMCGFALGVKMNALVLVGFLTVAAFYHRLAIERQGAAAGARAAAILVGIAALVASPWYIKSYLWTGNPVYPFFYELFGGRYWTAEGARLYREEQLTFGMGWKPLAALLLPWNLTMHGARFSNFPNRPLIYTSIGPLFLALLPALLLLGKLERRVKFLLIYSLIAFGAWFVLSQHMRYAIPLLPPVALCAGYAGSEILRRARKELRPFALIAIVLVCVMSLGIFAFVVADGIPAALGRETEDAYLNRTLNGLYTMAQVVNSLPPGSKVIIHDDTRGFYFETPYMWGVGHSYMIRHDLLTGPDDLVRTYRAHGLTHVLMARRFFDTVKARRTELADLFADAMDRRELTVVARRGDLILLRIRHQVRTDRGKH
jgi:hypothetical protein